MTIRHKLTAGAVGLAMLAGSAWCLAGSVTQFRVDSRHTGFKSSTLALPVGLYWKFSTGHPEEHAFSTPAVSDKAAYFCHGGSVYALDLRTGEPLWEFQRDTKFHTAPALHGDCVYVGSTDGFLRALDQEKGRERWSFKANGPIDSSPTIHAGIIYFGSDDKNLYALDLRDQQLLWQYTTKGAIKSSPAIYRGRVFFSSQDRHVYSVSNRGKFVWRTSLDYSAMFSSPTVDRGKVIVGSRQKLFCLDADDGHVIWKRAMGGVVAGSPAIHGGRAYVGTKAGYVYAVGLAKGDIIWRYPHTEPADPQPVLSSPIIMGDRLVVRMGKTTVTSLNISDGSPVWDYALAEPPEKKEKKKTAGAGEMGPGSIMPGGVEGMPGGAEGMPGAEMMGPGAMAPAEGMMGGVPSAGAETGHRRRGSSGRRRGGRRGTGVGTEVDMGGGVGGVGRGGRRAQDVERTELKFEDNFASSVACVEGALYVLGDDGALYAMMSSAVDAAPPVVKQPLLDVPSKGDKRLVFPLDILHEGDPDDRYAEDVKIPGSPTIYLSVLLRDEGTGVNPDSIVVSLNGTVVDHVYQQAKGLLWGIHEPKRGTSRNLKDGLQKFEIKASDWKGQQAISRFAFTVDNSLPPPEPPKAAQPAAGMMMGPEGMEPGMMGPEGMPMAPPGGMPMAPP